MIAKELVFDRIEQSFDLLFKNKKNFFYLILPLYTYKLLIWIFLWNFISFVLLGNIDNKSPEFLISLTIIIIIWFLLYITFFIWFLISIIKSIKDIYEEKETNWEKNLKYWIRSIIPSFKTYWYIFSYITTIPFIFIALWWISIISWYYLENSILSSIWTTTLITWLILLLLFMMYRWVKTNFSITSAVDKDDYSKKNFLTSIFITDNNWWRIVWNFLLLSIFITIIFSIINLILSFFTTSLSDTIWFQQLLKKYNNGNLDKNSLELIKDQINQYYSSFYLNNFIVSIFELFFDIIWYVFTLIFTYLLYKRLYFEKFNKNNSIEILEENNEL